MYDPRDQDDQIAPDEIEDCDRHDGFVYDQEDKYDRDDYVDYDD